MRGVLWGQRNNSVHLKLQTFQADPIPWSPSPRAAPIKPPGSPDYRTERKHGCQGATALFCTDQACWDPHARGICLLLDPSGLSSTATLAGSGLRAPGKAWPVSLFLQSRGVRKSWRAVHLRRLETNTGQSGSTGCRKCVWGAEALIFHIPGWHSCRDTIQRNEGS